MTEPDETPTTEDAVEVEASTDAEPEVAADDDE